MIDDIELRGLFQAECEEHLQRLDEGLLRLEQAKAADPKTLTDVFREAHSLKGAARMLGLDVMERLAHRFEDILGGARKDGALPAVADRLSRSVGALRALANEAVTGAPAHVDVDALLADLGRGEQGPPPSSPAQAPEPVPAQAPEPVPARPPAAPAVLPEPARLDTIRVPAGKLDEMMRISGELSVVKIRIAQRVADIEAISFPSGVGSALSALRSAAAEDAARLDLVAGELEDGIRSMRLLPLSTLFAFFPRMVRDLAHQLAKEVDLVFEGAEILVDKRVVEEMKDPLMHLLRNAVDHGLEAPEARLLCAKPRAGRLLVCASRTLTTVTIAVKDDGRGIDVEEVKRAAIRRGVCRPEEALQMTAAQVRALIFSPGFSTSATVTGVSGRGVGLDVVRSTVERLKGTVHVSANEGVGATFRIELPAALTTTRVLTGRIVGRTFAVPVEHVHSVKLVSPEEIFSLEGRKTIVIDGQPVSLAHLGDLLEVPESAAEMARGGRSAGAATPGALLPCICIAIGEERLAVLADELTAEQEVVVKAPSGILARVRNVAGMTILGTGEICIVVNAADLLRTVAKRSGAARHEPAPAAVTAAARKSVLLVEDSITTRTQLTRILGGAGFDVETAVDGADGLRKLRLRRFDAVVSDVEMPNMDGLTLAARIRADPKLGRLPIVLVTALASEEDRRRGLEVGANAYLTKPTFDQRVFIETVRRLA